MVILVYIFSLSIFRLISCCCPCHVLEIILSNTLGNIALWYVGQCCLFCPSVWYWVSGRVTSSLWDPSVWQPLISLHCHCTLQCIFLFKNNNKYNFDDISFEKYMYVCIVVHALNFFLVLTGALYFITRHNWPTHQLVQLFQPGQHTTQQSLWIAAVV